jgi:predicted HicB family RNase H-like nuclease
MKPEVHQMTVRLPGTVYEKLRREAFERRMPMNEIITQALQEHTNKTQEDGR